MSEEYIFKGRPYKNCNETVEPVDFYKWLYSPRWDHDEAMHIDRMLSRHDGIRMTAAYLKKYYPSEMANFSAERIMSLLRGLEFGGKDY